jgi:hypothetical protein
LDGVGVRSLNLHQNFGQSEAKGIVITIFSQRHHLNKKSREINLPQNVSGDASCPRPCFMVGQNN